LERASILHYTTKASRGSPTHAAVLLNMHICTSYALPLTHRAIDDMSLSAISIIFSIEHKLSVSTSIVFIRFQTIGCNLCKYLGVMSCIPLCIWHDKFTCCISAFATSMQMLLCRVHVLHTFYTHFIPLCMILWHIFEFIFIFYVIVRVGLHNTGESLFCQVFSLLCGLSHV
jgi:hypothetical protein